MRTLLINLLVTLFGAVTSASAQALKPDLSYVQLEGVETRDLMVGDVNGDGLDDLVVSTAPVDGARWLHVHFARKKAPRFETRPNRRLRLVRDAVAFTLADVDPAPGREIVLLSPSRAAAVVWADDRADARPRYSALARIELLWQPADPDLCFAWRDGALDLDGDGLDDLLVPEPSGYRIALQRRSAETTFVTTRLEVPPSDSTAVTARGGSRFTRTSARLELSLGTDEDAGPLVRVLDETPAPQAVDQDGDGRTDIVALSGDQLLVWRQGDAGAFGAQPSARADFGAKLDSQSKRWAIKALLRDLDGAPGAEVIVTSTQDRGGDVYTMLEVFSDLDSINKNSPSDKLRLRGWTNDPQFDDVDADGRADLSIGSLRADALSALSGGDAKLEGQLNVFRNGFEGGKGRFARPVALAHRVQLPTDELQSRKATVRFFRDANGDGLRDLLFAVGDELRLYPVRKRGRGLRLEDPAWQMKLVEDAVVQVDDASGLVLIREPNQVITVEIGA